MSMLLSLQSFLSTQPVIDFMTNILAAICVLLVTFILSRWVKLSIARMGFKYDQLDDTLFVFLSKFSQIVVIIVGATFVLNSFGVQTTSIVALLGAAGLADASDYLTLKFDMTRSVKEAFDAAGIEIPFPTTRIVNSTDPN
jgi:small-conductance mechanosensitive channel